MCSLQNMSETQDQLCRVDAIPERFGQLLSPNDPRPMPHFSWSRLHTHCSHGQFKMTVTTSRVDSVSQPGVVVHLLSSTQ